MYAVIKTGGKQYRVAKDDIDGVIHDAARNEACSGNSDCCSGRCRRNRGVCR